MPITWCTGPDEHGHATTYGEIVIATIHHISHEILGSGIIHEDQTGTGVLPHGLGTTGIVMIPPQGIPAIMDGDIDSGDGYIP
jgi:hypothetical protein